MARFDKWMMPYGNPINPLTKKPIYGDPMSIISGIGAAGSLIGGISGADASSSAADAQTAAANQATEQQQKMFDTINNQQAPYRQAGNTGLSALMYSMGLGSPSGMNFNNQSGQEKPQDYASWAAGQPQAAPVDRRYVENFGMDSGFNSPSFINGGIGMGSGRGQPWPGANSSATHGGPTQDGYNNYLNSFNQSHQQNGDGYHNAQTFDTAGYLAKNPDVAANPYWSKNAYLHYQQHGQAESRQFVGNDKMTSPGVPGVGFGDLAHQFNANDLKTNLSPSYQFMLSQGEGALQNSAAAQGNLVSGNALKGINDYAQNYASNGYQQAYNNYNNNQNNIFSRLSSIAGMGQSANNTTATAGAAFSPGIASTIQGAGQAQASGIVGASNNMRQGMNNAQSWYQYGSNPLSGVGGSGSNNASPGIVLPGSTQIGNF